MSEIRIIFFHSSIKKLLEQISKIFQDIKPEIIYVMNRSDAHSDHRIVFDAVMSCTKSFRYPYIKKVLMYECLSETEFAPILPERVFQPNYFVDISNFLHKKIEIMKFKSGFEKMFQVREENNKEKEINEAPRRNPRGFIFIVSFVYLLECLIGPL